MTDDIPRDVRDAWSRIGQYMQAGASYGTRVADRNVKLWAATNEQLSKGPYTVDAAANDMLRLMAVGQQNLEDLWFLMSRPADSGRYVKVLPTAFLFFDIRGEPPARVLIDPVDIPVPPEVAPGSLWDEETVIALSGTIARSKASGAEAEEEQSTEAVDRLTDRLSVHFQPGGRTFRIEAPAEEGKKEPLPGVYDGLVYLKDPPLPLANLRIIVEGPPPPVGSE